jgi:hypothetical protein
MKSLLLGAEPVVGVRKGEIYLGYGGKQKEAKTGRWQLSTGYESLPHIGRQISSLLDKLTSDLNVWQDMKERFGCHISVGGYFKDWTGGFFLEADTLILLVDRGLGVDFDLYAPDTSEP